jgi:hypothetical protein
MAGPTCLPAEHALQIIHRISKKVPSAAYH